MEKASSGNLTVQDCVAMATKKLDASDVFLGHGTDNALYEAVRLVWFCLGLPADSDDEVLKHTVSLQDLECIEALLEQRITERKPLAYLTQQAWFMGMPFYVDERVLVPRSPFSELIAKQFHPWVKAEQVSAILEIGTGSGCMAIAAAHMFEHVKVDAGDISQDALDVAALNVAAHEVYDQVDLIHSDCFDRIASKKYDIIMSNPPYVSADEMRLLPSEYEREPADALQAGEDGLSVVTTILKNASSFLKPHGILVVEVGLSQMALIQAFPQVPFTWLELEHGGEGIFVLDYAALLAVSKC